MMRPARPLALAFVLLAACGAPSTAPTSGARAAAEMPRTAATPPAPAAAPSFEGVVRGPDGKPSAGAVVAVFGETDGGTGYEVPGPVSTATSGPDGVFRLTGVLAGNYAISAHKPGFAAVAQTDLALKPGEPVRGVELALGKAGRTLRGVVRAASTNQPLPDVEVRVQRAAYGITIDTYAARTDARGGYAITLPAGDYIVLPVSPGRAATSRTAVLDRDRIVDFTLDPTAVAEPASAEVIDWIRKTSVPISTVEAGRGLADLAPVKEIVGRARVVALGEATHGTREFFQMKHRMLEFLATEMGFTVFGIEASMPECFAVNEYVLTGKGDARQALTGLHFWTWNTEEVLALIEWMRTYNADRGHPKKLKFLGFDMQSPVRGTRIALAYLRRVEPAEARRLEGPLDLVADAFRHQRFWTAPEADRKATLGAAKEMLAALDKGRAAYVRKTSADDFAIARQHARVAVQALAMSTVSETESLNLRDEAMAENVRWILEREGPDAKAVLWAHNGHVSLGQEWGQSWMGGHLRRALGEAFVTVGFAFNQGSFQAKDLSAGLRDFTVGAAPPRALEAAFAAAGHPLALLDMRRVPQGGAVAEWFAAPRPMRELGALSTEGSAATQMVRRRAKDAFDALIYVDRTTAARKLESPQPEPELRDAPENLGFEEAGERGKPAAWAVSSDSSAIAVDAAVEVEAKAGGAHGGKRALVIRRGPGPHYGENLVLVSQALKAAGRQGKRVSLRLFARASAGSRAYARLAAFPGMNRVDARLDAEAPGSAAGAGAGAAAGAGAGAGGAKNWREIRLELDVPAEAKAITYGVVIAGEGTVEIDDMEITP